MEAFIQWFLSQISPQLRGLVIKVIKDLETLSKTTPNKWDDIFVAVLKQILDIKE